MVADSDTDTVAASISPELKRRIRVEAAKRDQPMSEIVREAIEQWYEREATDTVNN